MQSRELTFVFQQSGVPFPTRGLIILATRRPELSAIFELCQWSGRRLTVAILVGQRTSSTEPGGLALLGGDASGDSWFREIHVPQAWRVYLATGLDFREKNRASFESIGTRLWLQSPTLPLYYEGKMMMTPFPQNYVWRIKDNNNSPHGKFHRFLFPFSSKFSDLNFTSYVLYIFLYYVTCHTQ